MVRRTINNFARFAVTFEPNTLGRESGSGEGSRIEYVTARGTKDALNQANNRFFNFAQVRFINHPDAHGLGQVYDEDGNTIGQLTAKRA